MSETTDKETEETLASTQESYIIPRSVEEDEEAGTVTVSINVSDLPEGTSAIALPNGEIVELGDGETVKITVSKDDLDDSGVFEIVAIDDEGMLLANCNVQVSSDVLTRLADIEDIGGSFLSVLLWILGGAAVAGGLAVAIYLTLKKRKNN